MAACDVIIIGAGVCGLTLGRDLSKTGMKVQILEGKESLGGRIMTIHPAKFDMHVEMGAEFIHGDLPETLKMLNEYGIAYHKIGGSFVRAQDKKLKKEEEQVEDRNHVLETALKLLKEDMPVEEFLTKYVTVEQIKEEVRQYVQGYAAAHLNRASALSFKKDWLSTDEDQYRLNHGYNELIDALHADCLEHGCNIKTGTVVKKIAWKKNDVTVFTEMRKNFNASKVVMTVPLGVLNATPGIKSAIQFVPEIAETSKLISELGYGNAIKFIFQFKDTFWNSVKNKSFLKTDLNNLGFLLSSETIPTWWTQFPENSNILTGWVGGPATQKYVHASEDVLYKEAVKSLAGIFSMSAQEIDEKVVTHKFIDWSVDPFTRGAYSYDVVGGKELKEKICMPIEDTIFFAGEAFSDSDATGTVEAAISSAFKTKEILQRLSSL